MDANYAKVQTVLAATRRIGAPLPVAITTAADRAAAIARAGENVARPHHELMAAMVRAVDQGKDPALDKDVQRWIAGQALANDAVLHGMRAEAADILTTALIEHQADLLTSWRTLFDNTVDTLHDTHDVLGDIDLTNTEAIVQRGPDANTAWATATNAITTLRNIATAWQTWATATRAAAVNRDHAIHIVAEVDWQTYRDNTLGGTVDYWQLVGLDVTLTLADPDEYKQRIRDVDTERAAEAAAEKAARHDRMQLR